MQYSEGQNNFSRVTLIRLGLRISFRYGKLGSLVVFKVANLADKSSLGKGDLERCSDLWF